MDELLEVCTAAENGPNGQVSRTVEFRDGDGALVSATKLVWVYYPTGEVDTITIVEIDAAGVETGRRTIKHYTDGRQPEAV